VVDFGNGGTMNRTLEDRMLQPFSDFCVGNAGRDALAPGINRPFQGRLGHRSSRAFGMTSLLELLAKLWRPLR